MDFLILKRCGRGGNESVHLAPGMLHPAGFDYHARHELFVTMQGSTLRAWVDGRFVGEAEDATFATGGLEIGLLPSSVVYQVEIAELK